MSRYFSQEKSAAAVLMVVGLAALAAAAALWSAAGPYRGMVGPLAAIGALQFLVGAAIHVRTDAQVDDLRRRLAADEREGRRVERDRMRRVLASFRFYKAAEMVLLTAGLTLAFLFPRGHVLHGAGLACFLQGSVTLVFDRLAERRAAEWVEVLETRD